MSNEYYSAVLKGKDKEADRSIRQNAELALALNQVRLTRWDDARKRLEAFLKAHPESQDCDHALLGLVMVYQKRGKPADAARAYEQMKSRYPASPATAMAAQALASASR